MSKVRGKDTWIERFVRSQLHRKGFRFRKNVASLPGRPDIVYPSTILSFSCMDASGMGTKIVKHQNYLRRGGDFGNKKYWAI